MPTLDPTRLAQLAQSAQGGDADALSELLAQLHPKLYYTALKMTGDRAEAEDLAQDACLRLLDGLSQLRDPMAVLSWADTIVKNLCLNHLKRKRPYLFQDDQAAQAALDNLPEEKDDAVPDRYMDMAAKRDIILGMIDALPDAQRLTVYLYYYSAHSVQEIAQLMDVSPGTVKSRLAAARASLKLQVEEEERRGNKLYLIFPFLGRLLREDAQSAQAPVPLPVSQAQIATCAQQCAATAAAARAAGGQAAARPARQAGAKAAGKKAAKAIAGKEATGSGVAMGPLGVKIMAALAVVGLLSVGIRFLPRLMGQGGAPTPTQEAAAPSPTLEVTPSPTPMPEPSVEPSPEPSLSPTDFDPEAMIGQDLSALVAIAGEPNEVDGTIRRWNGGMDYDFSVNLYEDSQTIRELFIIYGPTVLGLDFGTDAQAAQAALAALNGPGGVSSVDTGGGQTSYVSTNADSTRLYQFDCMGGSVFMRSIHDVS